MVNFLCLTWKHSLGIYPCTQVSWLRNLFVIHQPFFVSENRDKPSLVCMKIWSKLSFVLSQSTRLTDGRTDGWTAFSWLYRALHYIQSHGKRESNNKRSFVMITRTCWEFMLAGAHCDLASWVVSTSELKEHVPKSNSMADNSRRFISESIITHCAPDVVM